MVNCTKINNVTETITKKKQALIAGTINNGNRGCTWYPIKETLWKS